MLRGDESAQLREALQSPNSSLRLQAALAAGMRPEPSLVEVLLERCATEPDFYVRDMLTWALTRHPADDTVPLLIEATREDESQARSQALHTLSKVGDPRGWAAVTRELLEDADDDVARSAWRAAVALVPESAKAELAGVLATQLGRGERSVQLSLSRALVALGEAAARALSDAAAHEDERVRVHAIATERLARHPDASFELSIVEAKRIVALTGAPVVPDEAPPGEHVPSLGDDDDEHPSPHRLEER